MSVRKLRGSFGMAARLVSISLFLSACSNNGVQLFGRAAGSKSVQWLDECSNATGIVLVNGKFHTMDPGKRVVSTVRLQDNIIQAVSNEDAETVGVSGDCKIDLAGRTVIPGLIENHNHLNSRGAKPGNLVFNMDSARTWNDAVTLIQKKIEENNVPLPEEGTVGSQANFITVVGAISHRQFVEGHLPDFETLNQFEHPVYMEASMSFETRTNAAGRDYFRSKGLKVTDDGVIVDNGPSPFFTYGMTLLKEDQTRADKLKGVLEAHAWSASLGITMTQVMDTFAPGLAQQIFEEGNAVMRVREAYAGWLATESADQTSNAITQAKEFNETRGNDIYRKYAVGEFLDANSHSLRGRIIGDIVNEATFMPKADIAIKNGITVHQHSMNSLETEAYLRAFEELPGDISELRWQLAHVAGMTTEHMDRLHALGGGAVMGSFSYSSRPGPPMSTPYKKLYEHDLPVGMGSDGGNIFVINPWLGIYHLTTGKNDRGQVILAEDERLTIHQAIEIMTIGNAWFSFDEHKLGSIEEGKLADLAVLSDAIFEMEDLERLRDVKSVMTIMNGKIVYSDSRVVACANANKFGEWYPRSGGEVCEL